MPESKVGTKIVILRPSERMFRPPQLASLGCHFTGACNPHPDHTDNDTILGGIKKRFVSRPPEPDVKLLPGFRRFVRRWLKRNLKPLEPNVDTSVETWLEHTNYPAWRKTQLLQAWKNFDGVFIDRWGRTTKYSHVKSFIKDECYPEFKHARAINSRRDEFKCRVGPIFKLIEKEVFKLDWFIKYVPVIDRARHIVDNLSQSGCRIASTDYSSFETHFTRQAMESCEFQLYEYMTQYLPDKQWMYLVRNIIGGKNHCEFKNIYVDVEATRMSGEMNTSLGNGFANLMIMLYTLNRIGAKSIKGRIEGDDGLFTFYGRIPTVEDFKKLGFTIKLEMHDELTYASFCGLLADPDELITITDPTVAIMNFGYTSKEYVASSKSKMLGLLRAKGLSMAYQYPGCPILASLARYAIRVTEGTRALIGSKTELYKRDFMIEAMNYIRDNGIPHRDVGIKTRFLMEKVYEIPVEVQVATEAYLDSLTTLQPLEIPGLLEYCHPDAIKFYENYSLTVNFKNSFNINCPSAMYALRATKK